ncbi:uncharacterized protein [Procambarus clarkii]|uniref:uncharacterized protein n=1 Tax=Procambarus clarkii TaxID=6728 RepID=UPI003743283B
MTGVYLSAYLLVVPTSSGVVGQVLRVAETEGVTRHAAFFILDPLYAPTPTHATRFRAFKQLSEMPTEAARAVMVLAAATRGPPNMATRGPPNMATRGPANMATRGPPNMATRGPPNMATRDPQDSKTDSHTSSPSLDSPPGDHSKRKEGKESQQNGREGKGRNVIPQATPSSNLNQSAASEREAVVARLVYDSVSLLSHLLRTNVGTFRLRRSHRPTNLTSEALLLTPSDDAQQPHVKDMLEAQPEEAEGLRRKKRMEGEKCEADGRSPWETPAARAVFGWSPPVAALLSQREVTADDEASSLLIRDLKANVRLAEDEAERERLYFEMKKLDKEKEGRDFERRLESIIGSRRIKDHSFGPQGKAEGANRTQMEMKLTKPTFFPALWGDGFVSSTGERNFDFLLLDWRPDTQELVTVLRLVHHHTHYSQVSEEGVEDAEIDWAHDTPVPRDPECGSNDVCAYVVPGIRLAPGYVVMIVVTVVLLLAACCASAAVLRWVLALTTPPAACPSLHHHQQESGKLSAETWVSNIKALSPLQAMMLGLQKVPPSGIRTARSTSKPLPQAAGYELGDIVMTLHPSPHVSCGMPVPGVWQALQRPEASGLPPSCSRRSGYSVCPHLDGMSKISSA